MTKSKGKASCFTVILAILFPPLGVLIRFGCGYQFWLCLLLTLLGYLPGIIYAVCTVCEEQ
ncbi:hypothetical protein PAHAL_8G063000 [Panicum hallii]|uniref:Hydrophobic protein OSR8 n=1 Tax=Panicum hallii TaxID=206008 RepID=A0A2S3ID37_9POAL|nr:hypothetical protein PAHAL_8G062800 [Panicum hallii]PVH33777.1 hypothetical protein PAHAL_8G063000 [Panicum hallii]